MVPKCLTYSWSYDWICHWQCCLSIRRYSTNFRAKHWRKFDLCYSIHSGLLHRKCVEFLFCQTTLFNLFENSRRLGKRKKNEIEQMASCGLMVRTLIKSFFLNIWHLILFAQRSLVIVYGTIQVLRQQRSGWVGSKNGNFCWFTVLPIYSDVGGWVGLKKPKTCLRNTWMVPK